MKQDSHAAHMGLSYLIWRDTPERASGLKRRVFSKKCLFYIDFIHTVLKPKQFSSEYKPGRGGGALEHNSLPVHILDSREKEKKNKKYRGMNVSSAMKQQLNDWFYIQNRFKNINLAV